MSIVTHKSHIGKEDMDIQYNVNTSETFMRFTSTGGKITIIKMPDIWDGYGFINTGKVLVRALDDHDTILHSFGGLT
jgi:hypothetical protein